VAYELAIQITCDREAIIPSIINDSGAGAKIYMAWGLDIIAKLLKTGLRALDYSFLAITVTAICVCFSAIFADMQEQTRTGMSRYEQIVLPLIRAG